MKSFVKIAICISLAVVLACFIYIQTLPGSHPRETNSCFSEITDTQSASQSINHCTKVIAQKNRHLVRALQYRAGAYAFLKKYEDAKKDTLSVLEITSDDVLRLNLQTVLVGVEAQLGNYQTATDIIVDLLSQMPTDDRLIHDLLMHVLRANDQLFLQRVIDELHEHPKLRAASILYSFYQTLGRKTSKEAASFLKTQLESYPISDPLGMMILHRTLVWFCERFPNQCPLLSGRKEVLAHFEENMTCRSASESAYHLGNLPDGHKIIDDASILTDPPRVGTLYLEILGDFIARPDKHTALQVLNLNMLIECANNGTAMREFSEGGLAVWNDFIESTYSSTHQNIRSLASYFIIID